MSAVSQQAAIQLCCHRIPIPLCFLDVSQFSEEQTSSAGSFLGAWSGLAAGVEHAEGTQDGFLGVRPIELLPEECEEDGEVDGTLPFLQHGVQLFLRNTYPPELGIGLLQV